MASHKRVPFSSEFLEPDIPPSAVLDPPQPPQTAEPPQQTTATLAATDAAPDRKPALPALTGLRTILAVNIMLFHFTPPHIAWIAPVVNNAYVFVGFFFLISGFVLAYNYADRPKLSKRNFYIARLSRVYPVYLLTLVLSFPFLLIEWHAHSPKDFYTGLILTPLTLQGWSPSLATFWNTVGWTLPAEMMLYGLFPFILIVLAAFYRGPGRKFATPGWLIATILAVWAIGLVPHTIYLFTNPDNLTGTVDRYTYGYYLRALKYTPPAYFCIFTCGVLLARLHAVLHLTPFRRGLLAFSALVCLALFFAFAVNRVPYVLVHGAIMLPLFAALLIGLSGPNIFSSALSWKPLVVFGETTFALYLLHFNGLQALRLYHVTDRLHLAAFDPWISYLAIFVLAFFVHHIYENPARKFVLHTFSPKP